MCRGRGSGFHPCTVYMFAKINDARCAARLVQCTAAQSTFEGQNLARFDNARQSSIVKHESKCVARHWTQHNERSSTGWDFLGKSAPSICTTRSVAPCAERSNVALVGLVSWPASCAFLRCNRNSTPHSSLVALCAYALALGGLFASRLTVMLQTHGGLTKSRFCFAVGSRCTHRPPPCV